MTIIDGRKIAQDIKDKLKQEVAKMERPPVLAAILVGEDPASVLYVRIKEKACQEVRIDFRKYLMPEHVSESDLLYLINDLNNDKTIDGIIVQLPLPKKFYSEKIISSIDSRKDVDALNPQSEVRPPTVNAILEIFEKYDIDLKNKNICLVGYGRLVGKPLAIELKKMGIKLDICDSETKDLAEHTKKADILISATGVPHLITKDMVKKDAVVIDAGTSVEKQSDIKHKTIDDRRKTRRTTITDQRTTNIKGDVDFENVKEKTSYITPPTGGIGPITVAKLLENVVKFSKSENKF